MTVCGIVAEYNPFHNGHLYQIEEVKKRGATHIVAVMSGNFVQRAEPAVIDKFSRAKVAAECGADLVVELPLAYATAVSERFAYGAVSLLDAMGCVDWLCFGSESGDIGALTTAAEATRDARVRRRIKQLTEMGESYPAAETKALQVFFSEIAELTKQPNNTLGIDYLKALKRRDSRIEPVTVKRVGAEHDAPESTGRFASASRLRELVRNRGIYTKFMPLPSELSLLDATVGGHISRGLSPLEAAILMKLRLMARDDFLKLPDAASGLGDRLFHAAEEATTLDDLLTLGKTRRYTMSRVRRAVLAALLGITGDDYTDIPYLRLLAIGKRGDEILRFAKKSSVLPVSGSLKEIVDLGGRAAATAKKEAAATDIYTLTLFSPLPKGQDYTTKLYRA